MADPIDRRSILTAAVAGGLSLAAAEPKQRPNILHIMTDQQQWATLAGRSECRTPHLNRLASSGMLFERSYTPCAVCCPVRAMILSGAYPWHTGVYNQVHSPPSVHRDMNEDVVLYSHRLRDVGYRQGYVGKWHASFVRTPLDFGFQEVADLSGCDPHLLSRLNNNPDNVKRPGEKRKITPVRTMQWPGSEPFLMWGYQEGSEEETPEYYRAECAVRMLRRFAHGQQPWHLEVHFEAPHDPYLPLKTYRDRYDAQAIPVPPSFYDHFENKPGLHRRESLTWGHINEDDYRLGRAHYYAYTEQVDAQIGRILDALQESGQEQNTIVVATADHGDMVGAHRMWLKGWIPYQETYRIPLIVRWPGRIQPGSKSGKLVQTHDLAHTYVAAAGARSLPFPDGHALQTLFEDPNSDLWRSQIMCVYYGGEFLYTQRIAITDRLKYVFNGFDIDECYDLVGDPHELHNLVASEAHTIQVNDMRARLYELMNECNDPYGPLTRPDAPMRGDRYCAPRYLPRGKRLT